MADPQIRFTTEIQHTLDELVEQGVAAIRAATAEMSRELRETHIPDEAPRGATGALASDWQEREVDPLTRVVTPGTDAWYAHIVARGRSGVQPSPSRRALQIGDQFRASAGPAGGDPFDQRAIAAMEQGADQIMADALAAEGIG